MLVVISGDLTQLLADAGADPARRAELFARVYDESRQLARLEALRLQYEEGDPEARCNAFAKLREPLTDPTAVPVISLFLAACHRNLGDETGAREVLSTIEPELLDQVTGDPALARLRATAEGRPESPADKGVETRPVSK